MRALRALGHVALRAVLRMRRAPAATAWTVGIIAVALALGGAAQLTAHNVTRATSGLGAGDMVVYLGAAVAADQVAAIRAALDGLPGVEGQVYVPPEQALERFRAALGGRELVAGLEAEMLPASIEVSLAPGVERVAELHPMIESLRAAPGVESVEFTGDWTRRSSAIGAGLRRASWLVAALVIVVCAYLVIAAIRLRLRLRAERREDAVLRLVGATGAFVRGPYVIAGAIHGVVGAALAALALWLVFRHAASDVEHALGAAFDAAPRLAFLPAGQLAVLIACGAALGAAASFLASRGHAVG